MSTMIIYPIFIKESSVFSSHTVFLYKKPPAPPTSRCTFSTRSVFSGGKSILFPFRIRLRTVDRAPCMLVRCIKCRQLQRTVPVVEDIMPCSAGHKNRISRTKMMLDVHLLFTRPHADNPSSLFHPDELFCDRVHFHPDLTTGRNAH